MEQTHAQCTKCAHIYPKKAFRRLLSPNLARARGLSGRTKHYLYSKDCIYCRPVKTVNDRSIAELKKMLLSGNTFNAPQLKRTIARREREYRLNALTKGGKYTPKSARRTAYEIAQAKALKKPAQELTDSQKIEVNQLAGVEIYNVLTDADFNID